MEATPTLREDKAAKRKEKKKKMEYRLKLGAVVGVVASIGAYLSWTSMGFYFLRTLNITVTETQESWVGSMVPLGAVFGTLSTGILADKCGRKYIAWSTIIPLFATWFIISWVYDKAWTYAARFFAGLGCGAASVVIPIYLYEIADQAYRHNIVQEIHEKLNMGILFTYIVEMFPHASYTDPMNEPFKRPNIMMMSLLALFPLISMFGVPESPTWLVSHGRRLEAEKAIKKLTGNYVKLEPTEPQITYGNSGLRLSALLATSNGRDIVLILCLIVFQQISGIGPLLFYTKDVLDTVARDDISAKLYLLSMLIPMILTYGSSKLVKWLGEKNLLIISTSLMSISLLLLAGYSHYLDYPAFKEKFHSNAHPVILLSIYMSAFHMGLGPVPWIFIGKMFPSTNRRIMYNLALTCSWAILFITTKTYQNMLLLVGISVILLLYGLINLVAIIFVLLVIPKSINEVEEEISTNLNSGYINLTPPSV